MASVSPIVVPVQVRPANVLLRLGRSRKVWVALSTVAMNLVVVCGLDPAKWTPLITAITTLGGLVVAGIAYEDGRLKGAPTDAPSNVTMVGKPDLPGPQQGANAWPLLLAGGILAAIAAGAGGCQQLAAFAGAPAGPYVASDRGTYEAVAPEYAAYVAADPALSTEQKARRGRTVRTWAIRIEQAEAAGTTAPPATQPTDLYQPLTPRPGSPAGVERGATTPGADLSTVAPGAAAAEATGPGSAARPVPPAVSGTLDMRPAPVPERLR